MKRVTSQSTSYLGTQEQEKFIVTLKNTLNDIKRALERSESQKRTLMSILESGSVENQRRSASDIVVLPSELTLEDELQDTVKQLRNTQGNYETSKKQLLQTSEKLRSSEHKLKENKVCIDNIKDELIIVQTKYKCKAKELEEVKVRLDRRNESVVNIQRQLSDIKYKRWQMVMKLMSARTLVAISVDRVRQLESLLDTINFDFGCSNCREVEDDKTEQPRAPTPALLKNKTSIEICTPLAETNEFETTGSASYICLQRQMTCLQIQLQESEECRAQYAEEIKTLEDEIASLRDERSRYAMLEEKLLQTLGLMQSLLDVNTSRRTIGNLVVEAVERSVDPGTKEFSTLRFLNHLYSSTTECERLSTEGLVRLALQACSKVL